jgi:hypothetical protein
MSRECDSLRSPQFASSVIAAVEPAPVHRRVLYTITDVPLKAGRLIAGASTKLIIATARQQHKRRRTERDFDDGEHTRDPLSISLPIGASRPRSAEEGSPMRQKCSSSREPMSGAGEAAPS